LDKNRKKIKKVTKSTKTTKSDIFDPKKIKEFSKLDITFAMPVSSDIVPIQLMASYMNLFKSNHVFITDNTIPLDTCRNALVATFLVKRPQSKYLLFWDSDMIPPRDALYKLWLDNEDIVSCLYFQKAPPFYPLMTVRGITPSGVSGFVHMLDWEPGKKYHVHGIGLGFVLIKRKVFERLDFPWFKFGRFSEDYLFCEQARKAGFKITVDTGVVVKHMTYRLGVDDKFYNLYKQHEKLKATDFSPGDISDK